MCRRPSSTRTYTLFPVTTLCRAYDRLFFPHRAFVEGADERAEFLDQSAIKRALEGNDQRFEFAQPGPAPGPKFRLLRADIDVAVVAHEAPQAPALEIGRASCRESVCQ